MAKRKAKKKSPSSSRPPLLHPHLALEICVPHPHTKEPARSPKLPAPENSPTWSEILRPVDVPSPGFSENDGSSPYYSDSSSHYGSPILAPSELAAGPLKFPVASLLATMDSGPVMQGGLVSAQSHPPSDQAAVNGLNDPGPSDQAPTLGSDAPEQAAPSENSFGLAASLNVVWSQDPMVFEASTFPHARQPLPHSRIRQPDPMVETAHAGDSQPVPRKHTSNRQSKSGSGNPQILALGKASAASTGKTGVAVGIESVDNGLMASGNMTVDSSLVEAVDFSRSCLGSGSESSSKRFFGC
ncbi:hypothetical protein OIU77_006154 [Salix suchowensis]|uniref:Uncharacterized protein n=1 Tax=Salix suchowensis TaxID=1278906 RepID=A0ABQ9ARX3_9ROSI|nr:hypothetical protein OIU77_006154 [Salix suchowensis]